MSKQPIVIFIICLVLYASVNILLISFLSLFVIKNKKNNYKKSYINKTLLIINFSVLESSLIPLILGMVFSLTKTLTITHTKALTITFIAILIVLLFTVFVFTFFLLQYMAIGITDKNIEFLGEKIELNKIYNLEVDEKKSKFYIQYYEGKRGQKKYSFHLKSKAYLFLKENEDLLKEQMLHNDSDTKSEIIAK